LDDGDDEYETNYPAGQTNEQAPLTNVYPGEHVVQAEGEVHEAQSKIKYMNLDLEKNK